MKTWKTEIYRENNIRLMKCHIVILIFSLILGGIVTASVGNAQLFLLFMPGIFLHSLLAYGSYKKMEFSRKTSIVVFFLLAIGTIPIPIGLFVVLFVMPATQWQTPEN